MYTFPHRIPTFPELHKLSESGNLYKLNWTLKEKQIKNDYENFRILYKKHGEYVPEFEKDRIFPKEYLNWLYKLRFNIPDKYLNEFNYHIKCGKNVWKKMLINNKIHFKDDDGTDKMFKNLGIWCTEQNIGIEAALAHFEAAFSILDLCIKWPKKEKIYSFGKYVMLIYFLDGQLPTRHIFLLIDNKEYRNIFKSNKKIFKSVDDFVSQFNLSLNKIKKSYYNRIEKEKHNRIKNIKKYLESNIS